MRILLLSDNNYLFGLLKGYSLNVGCECEVEAIHESNHFYNTISNNPPLLVFIDMAQLSQLSGLAEWPAALRFIKQNHIILCGLGKPPFDNQGIQSNSAFETIFSEPFNEEEILTFLYDKLVEKKFLKKERRCSDRRNGTDRRKISTPKYATLPFSDVHSGSDSDQQQYSEEEFRVGSLLINRPHKVVTINDNPVDLSHKEFELIDYLATHSGSVVETKDIIHKVWAECTQATNADVHQYVHLLRKKIEVDPKNPKLLITVKGFGYELRP